MHRLRLLLRSLGTTGAMQNAGALASARRREDWVVAALERRVAPRPTSVPARRTA
jgi:hypothetical protein